MAGVLQVSLLTSFGCGSKRCTQNGILVNGKWTKTCGPIRGIILTRTHFKKGSNPWILVSGSFGQGEARHRHPRAQDTDQH